MFVANIHCLDSSTKMKLFFTFFSLVLSEKIGLSDEWLDQMNEHIIKVSRQKGPAKTTIIDLNQISSERKHP